MHCIDVKILDNRLRDSPPHYATAGSAGLDLRACLFIGFPQGALLGGFAQFQKTGRQRPLAQARLDGTAAEQDLIAPDRQATGNDVRILIVHGLATGADCALAAVAIRYAMFHGVTTVTAKIHGQAPD